MIPSPAQIKQRQRAKRAARLAIICDRHFGRLPGGFCNRCGGTVAEHERRKSTMKGSAS